MQIFYAHQLDEDFGVCGDFEASHALRSLRKKVGDIVYVTDGNGLIWKGVILTLTKKIMKVQLGPEVNHGISKPRTHLIIAPTKQINRIEMMLQKACEVGIASVQFIKTEHSERKSMKYDRLEKITIAAMKQAILPFKCEVKELISLEECVDKYRDFAGNKFIAKQEEGQPFLKDCHIENEETYVMVGPEGDFTLEEYNLVKNAGWEGVNLTPSRLRTETAGLYSVLTLQNKSF